MLLMSTTASEARHDVEEIPGLDELAAAFLTLRNARRGASASCAISAPAASWRRSPTAGRSSGCSRRDVPYLEIAERVHTSTATVTRVAQWLRHGAGGYAARAPPHPVGTRVSTAAGRPPARRRPLEGADGAARARAPRRGRASLRGRRAGAARPLPRTRRSTSCSSARTTSPSTCRTGSSTSGSPARTSSPRREADVVRLADLGFARCTLEAAVPVGRAAAGARRPRRPARRDGVPGLDPRGARRARASRPSWSRCRARSRRRRGSASRTRSSTSSPPARRRAPTACAGSAGCSRRRPC